MLELTGAVDFNNTMKSHAPYVFMFVLGLAFVLLLVTFRSIVIPFTTIVLNLIVSRIARPAGWRGTPRGGIEPWRSV